MSQKLTETETSCIIEDKEELEGKCMSLWVLSGKETSKWNGESCDCPYMQGNWVCKLNRN